MNLGNIEGIVNGEVVGWLHCHAEDVVPYVTVDDKPCLEIESTLDRDDVKEFLGIENGVGFRLALSDDFSYGHHSVKLFAVSETGIRLVSTQEIEFGYTNLRINNCIEKLEELSREEDSCAIAVWEGTHNPIGRAKVLYDTVSQKQKTVIVAFSFGFDTDLWRPLINTGTNVVIIPWNDRDHFAALMNDRGISFQNVWICKPRYPSFLLAHALSDPENTNFILDIDDYEVAMGNSDASRNRAYGNIPQHICEPLTDSIKAISAASLSLQKRYGGQILRHLRSELDDEDLCASNQAVLPNVSELVIGFIGTVRPHKGLEEFAGAVKLYNKSQGQDVKVSFRVEGQFAPPTLKNNLAELGAKVSGDIAWNELPQAIKALDVVVCGFPENKISDINKYQISSKIGDALRAGKSVLVPRTPATEDLENHPGIVLFDRYDLFEKLDHLIEASRNDSKISLPEEFTLSHGLNIYENLKEISKTDRAFNTTLQEYFAPKVRVIGNASASNPNLLLIWKQQDASIYGRRIDQIARSYKKYYPDHNVHVLEIASQEMYKNYKKQRYDYGSDAELILNTIDKKRQTLDQDGVNYTTILLDKSDSISEKMNQFQKLHNLYSCNTTVVYFPLVPSFSHIYESFSGYRYIVDVVDNQMSWDKKGPRNISARIQYKTLIDNSSAVIFNSKNNENVFREFDTGNSHSSRLVETIPNWYNKPPSYDTKRVELNKSKTNIVYSGNMNDRIDWGLISSLAKNTSDTATIHLFGTADRSLTDLEDVVKNTNIHYHGAIEESHLSCLLNEMDIAIVPHEVDDISLFMNPLKILMYQDYDLPIVTKDVPGINSFNNTNICSTQEQFIDAVNHLIDVNKSGNVVPISLDRENLTSDSEHRYMEVLSTLVQANTTVQEEQKHA